MARHARRLIIWTTGVLLSLVVLAALGIALFIWGIDPNMFRGRIERAATESLGRRVELTGALRWRPGLNFQIESLGGRIANAAGFGTAPLASWQALRLGVALRPLWDHRLVVDRIELQGLRLDLVRSAGGVNWSLPPSGAPQPEPGMALTLGGVSLSEATITFTDLAAGRAWTARDLALDMRWPAQAQASILVFSDLSLTTRLEGAPLEEAGIALRVELPRLELNRVEHRVRVPDWQLKWNDAKLDGSMELDIGGSPAAQGSLRMQAPSLRRLLQTASFAVPATRDAAVAGAVTLDTHFEVGAGSVALSQLDVKLDATRVQGEARVVASPAFSARFNLEADQLDVDRYLAPEDEPGTPLSLPLAQLQGLDAKGVLVIRRATLAGAVAREMRIDVE